MSLRNNILHGFIFHEKFVREVREESDKRREKLRDLFFSDLLRAPRLLGGAGAGWGRILCVGWGRILGDGWDSILGAGWGRFRCARWARVLGVGQVKIFFCGLLRDCHFSGLLLRFCPVIPTTWEHISILIFECCAPRCFTGPRSREGYPRSRIDDKRIWRLFLSK